MTKGCFQGFPFPDAIVCHCRFAASARNSLQIVALADVAVLNIEQISICGRHQHRVVSVDVVSHSCFLRYNSLH